MKSTTATENFLLSTLDKFDASSEQKVLPLILYIHPQYLNNVLPSVDLDCLLFLTIIRFAKVEAMIKTDVDPSSASPSKHLPFAIGVEKDSKHTSFLLDADSLLSFMSSWGVNVDLHLSAVERSRAFAYRSLIERFIKPALVFTLFCDIINYEKFTRYHYFTNFESMVASDLMFDLRQIKVTWLNEHLSSFPGKMHVRKQQIYKDYRDCLKSLSSLLENNSKKFFFDDQKPCSLDAHLFAYLSWIMNTGSKEATAKDVEISANMKHLPNSVLKETLLENEPLIKYYRRLKDLV